MKLSFLSYALIMGLTAPVWAGETTVSTADRTNLAVTIYNENRALIVDKRQTPLTAGTQAVAFAGISDQIIAPSALLTGAAIHVTEQNFNYDMLSYESLLQKSIGKTVRVRSINPATGRENIRLGELLSVQGISPILKINGMIESLKSTDQILFTDVPDNLRAQPTLVVDLTADKAQNADLMLTYLSTGLSWQANYVAEISENADTMSLNGYVTLTNNTAVPFQKADLNLVAGSVNLVPEYQPRSYRRNDMVMMTAEAAPMVAEEAFADYHLYTLPAKTDILPQQTKQVALLSATGIPVKKTYEFLNVIPNSGLVENMKPAVFLTFKNNEAAQMGIALPKGTVRLYQKNSQKNALFIGEDNIDHTAKNQTVRLKLGEAFDISADAKQVTYRKISDKVYQASYTMTIRNGSDTPVSVLVKQNLPKGSEIIRENVTSSAETSMMRVWDITLPTGGEHSLEYTVQVTHD